MSDPSPRNRRRARRLSPKRSTKAACLKGALGLGRNVAVAVLDVSETGARLRLKEALPPGQEVEVALEALQLLRPFKVPGVVVWCSAEEGGTHTAGIHFDKLVPFSVLQSLATG